MTMPSRQASIRDSIVAAILALPGWPAEVAVEKIAIPSDVFFRSYTTMVGVCLTEETWQSIDLGLGDPLDQPAEIDVSIVVYSTSALSPTGALEPDDGNIDGLVGLILGSGYSGYGDGLRSANIGVSGETGGVRLRAVGTQIMADQSRAQGSGGALAKIIMMRTTALPL